MGRPKKEIKAWEEPNYEWTCPNCKIPLVFRQPVREAVLHILNKKLPYNYTSDCYECNTCHYAFLVRNDNGQRVDKVLDREYRKVLHDAGASDFEINRMQYLVRRIKKKCKDEDQYIDRWLSGHNLSEID